LKKQNHQVNKMTLLLAIKYRNIFPAQPWMKTANPCPIRNFFLIPSPHALFFFNLDLIISIFHAIATGFPCAFPNSLPWRLNLSGN